MTLYDPIQITTTWVTAYGDKAPEVLAAATIVAQAESGGNTLAVSPQGDYGLWQINKIHLPALGYNTTFSDEDPRSIFQPFNNARAAIAISGNGKNWGAWCTAVANPARDCGHVFVPYPQVGSAAWKQTQYVLDHIQGAQWSYDFLNVGGSPVGEEAILNSWAAMQGYAQTGAPTQWARLQAIQDALGAARPRF